MGLRLLGRHGLRPIGLHFCDPAVSMQLTSLAAKRIALSSTFLVRWGRVQKLQINGVDQTSVEPDGTESVGVQLDFPAPRGAEVYILGSEDESIWPAPIG